MDDENELENQSIDIPIWKRYLLSVTEAAQFYHIGEKRKYVVDYFSFHTKCRKLERVVFNLEDMFIFLGGFLVIFWNMLRKS